jgi:hypothetical protein
VPDGTSLMLVPVSVITGKPTVGGRVAVVGEAMLLREDVMVEGGFYCLAVRVL